MDYDIKGIMGENTVTTLKDVRETLEELKQAVKEMCETFEEYKQAVEEMQKASKALLEEVSKPLIVR